MYLEDYFLEVKLNDEFVSLRSLPDRFIPEPIRVDLYILRKYWAEGTLGCNGKVFVHNQKLTMPSGGISLNGTDNLIVSNCYFE